MHAARHHVVSAPRITAVASTQPPLPELEQCLRVVRQRLHLERATHTMWGRDAAQNDNPRRVELGQAAAGAAAVGAAVDGDAVADCFARVTSMLTVSDSFAPCWRQ